MKPTVADVLRILVKRYHADREANEAFTDERARRLSHVALDSFMSNVETELQDIGLTLVGA